jgi:hypothetical protein
METATARMMERKAFTVLKYSLLFRAFTRGDGLPARPLRLIPSRDDRHRHPIKHHIGLVVSKFFSPLIFASYTPVDIRNALPIIPLTFRNQRVECFSDFLLTEFGDELSKLVLDFTSHRCVKLRRKSFRVWANTTVLLRLLPFEPVTARGLPNRLRTILALAMQFNSSQHHHG